MASSNSLSSLSKIHLILLHFSAIFFPQKLSIPEQTSHLSEKPCAISKSPPWTLIGHCPISDGKDQGDATGGLEEGDPNRDPKAEGTTFPQRDGVKEVAVEGTGDSAVSPASLPTRKLVCMVAEAGSLTSGGHMRPTRSGKALCKKGWAQKALEVPAGDVCSPWDQKVPEEHWDPHPQVTFVCLVHEISQAYGAYNLCFQVHTVQELQEPLSTIWHASLRI